MKEINKKEETSDDESGLGYQNTLVSMRFPSLYFLTVNILIYKNRFTDLIRL